MKRILSTSLVAALAMAGSGLTPRGGPSDYPAHANAGQLTVAAAAISADQAKKILGAGIDQAGYLVFEVALYPEPGSEITVSLGDFTLSLGADGSSMRAAEPDVVAAAVVPYPAIHLPDAPGKVHVSTETDIGYASGGYGRQGGVYTTQGVAVSNYPDQSPQPPPNTASKDLTRDQIERSLAAKRLPTGRITQPVAGYLYFPKPSGHSRKDGFHLAWFGETAQARMTVPPAK
jgi:hypothetical protein